MKNVLGGVVVGAMFGGLAVFALSSAITSTSHPENYDPVICEAIVQKSLFGGAVYSDLQPASNMAPNQCRVKFVSERGNLIFVEADYEKIDEEYFNYRFTRQEILEYAEQRSKQL